MKESVPTTELERQAGADVVDHQLVPDFGRSGYRIRATDRAQIGVAVFHAAEETVGEGIFEAGASRPAGMAAVAAGESLPGCTASTKFSTPNRPFRRTTNDRPRSRAGRVPSRRT